MKIVFKNILIIFFLAFLVRCDEDEVTSRNYPRVKTLAVSEISSEGARLNAEIIYRGDFEVINYGFVWGVTENPTKVNSDRVVFAENINTNKFSELIESTLKEDATYFVRAFVQTSDYTVYGENVSFLSLGSGAPKIEDIFPLEGTVGDTLTIVGKNFSYVDKNNEVYFNNVKTHPLNSTDSIITVLVPEIQDPTNKITISVSGNISIFSDSFIITSPQIDSINPKLVTFGDTIEVIGNNFSLSNQSNKIFFENTLAKVITSTKKRLEIIVPLDLERSTNKLKLIVGGKEISFNEPVLIKSPIIYTIESKVIRTFENDNLVISGENFNTYPQNISVSIGDLNAKVISSTLDQIIVEFPRMILPKVQLSVIDTLDVKVTILDQIVISKKLLEINYRSTWTKMRDFPGNSRFSGASFSIGDKGYIGLGTGYYLDNYFKDFWEYNPNSDMWIKLEDFPGAARSHFATVVIENSAYVFCGRLSSGNNSSEVWKFNGSTNTWTRMKDFPGGARHNVFGFSIGNIAFLGGGIYGTKDFWRYDSNTDSWSQLANLPEGIWFTNDLFSIADDKFGYLLAKASGSPNAQRDFWKYNPVNEQWQSIKDMPGQYYETTGFTINNKFYIGTGGNSWYGSSSFFSYKPSSDEWKYFPFIDNRRGASSFSINKFGYLLLGRSASHSANKNDVWRFDPEFE